MARRCSRFVRPQPKTKMWIGAGVGQTSIAASSVTLVSTLFAGALLLRPFTILRSHLLISVRSDQAVASENTIGAYGNTVVTDTAAAVGVTAVPDPSGISGDPEADWYLWQALQNAFVVDINGTEGIGMIGNNGVQYKVDSKAMRKVGPDDNVVAVCTAEIANPFLLITQGRTLIQLH